MVIGPAAVFIENAVLADIGLAVATGLAVVAALLMGEAADDEKTDVQPGSPPSPPPDLWETA